MDSHIITEKLLGLPGIPVSKAEKLEDQLRDLRRFLRNKGTAYITLPGKGSPKAWEVKSLPAVARKYLENQHLDAQAANLPAVREAVSVPAAIEPAPLPALTSLTKHQVTVMDARMWFIRLIENRAKGQSIKKCQHDIAESVAAGKQPYAQMAAAANDRQGQERTLSSRTLLRWWTDSDYGKNPAALAPLDADAKRVNRDALLVNFCRDHKPGIGLPALSELPVWLPYFLDAYRRPSKPSLRDAIDAMDREMPPGIPMPSYDQVRNLSKRIPEAYLQKGRLTGAELKAIMGFNRRDFSMDDPFTVGQIDGHSFKAYVAHPTTGAHFHPEVCGVICMTTKVLAGWSMGVAESANTVADAYRHACTVNEQKPWGGVFAMIEPDRGPGNMAKVNSDELTGRFARIGTEFLPPERGGNPQGHGGVERSNQSIWIRAAKRLATYTGKDMDRVTRKRIYVRLERDLKNAKNADLLGIDGKTSKLLLSWDEFIAFLHEEAIKYNNSPHSALPKITCPATGRRRHMTPFECLAMHMAKGWQPTVMGEDLLEYVFMPHVKIHVMRNEFTLLGNRYHSYELHQWHDRDMIAAYDIHDAKHVHVLNMDEQLITIATWNGNRIEGRPVSQKEQAIQKRADGQIKLHQRYIDQRQAETRQAVVIEHSPEVLAKAKPLEIVQQPESAPLIRPVFSIPPTQGGKYEYWCQIDARISAGEEVNADEKRFHTGFQKTAAWESERMYDQSAGALQAAL
jgi:putative transposase